MHEAFLDAILTSPEEDAHRLVYADWLEEHGDERDLARAHLIRAQCALALLAPDDARREPLEQQERQLLKTHGKRWTQPLRKARIGSNWTFRRGFLEKITISARDFVLVAQQLFQLAPTIRAMECPESSNEVSALAACPLLERIAELNLNAMCACGYCPIGRELSELFQSPFTAGLRILALSEDRIGPDGVTLLAASQHLAGLTRLDLSENRLGNSGARQLIESKHLKNLKFLDLRENKIGPRVTTALRERFGEVVVL